MDGRKFRFRIRFGFEPKAVGVLAHQRLGEELLFLQSKNEYPSVISFFYPPSNNDFYHL